MPLVTTRIARVAATSLVMLAALLPAAPGSALGERDLLGLAPPGVQRETRALTERTSFTRDRLQGSSVSEALRILAPDALPPGAVETAAAEDLAGAIASLHGAVTRAAALIGNPAQKEVSEDVTQLMSELPATFMQEGRLLRRWEHGEMWGTRRRGLEVDDFARTSTGVSPTWLAASEIAAELDRQLPVLEASSRGSTDQTAAACDVFERLPYVCVGSEAANGYTADAMLLVDLGGDDTYENSAGGAPFRDPTGTLLPVSVNIDLGGNDRYEAARATTVEIPDGGGTLWPPTETLPLVIAQGGGVAGSVGILLDTAGNDTYSAAAPPTSKESPSTAAVAQGSGIKGIGALIDQGGRDRYEALGSDGGGRLSVSAQGSSAGACRVDPFGAQGATGVLWGCNQGLGGILSDRGAQEDEYLIDAGKVDVPPTEALDLGHGYPLRAATGHGMTWGVGVGVLHDEGGPTNMSLSARARSVGGTRMPDGAPVAMALGQGYGRDGLGLLLTGAGDTDYLLEAPSEGMVILDVAEGQGSGHGLVGRGVLDDAAGDDTYTIRAASEYVHEILVGDPCDCEAAKASVSTAVNFTSLLGQGAGWLGGTGLLRDGSGNDLYDATNTRRMQISLRDTLSAPNEPPILHVGGYWPGGLWAQGASFAAAANTTGVLIDQGDSVDTYSASTTNETVASAGSDRAAGSPAVTAFPDGWILAGAQGSSSFGSGALIDDGSGAGTDRFDASATNTVETLPNRDGSFAPGSYWPYFQGSAYGGDGVLLASGSARMVSSPSRPACLPTGPAFRGYGDWMDCTDSSRPDPNQQSVEGDSTGSGGSNGQSPDDAAPSFTFTEDTPGEAPLDFAEMGPAAGRIPVGAVLETASGTPVAGAGVHFVLQAACGTVWCNGWQVEAVTDGDGMARARLPLLGTGLVQTQSPTSWRIYATFDGGEIPGSPGGGGLLPWHIAKPLELA